MLISPPGVIEWPGLPTADVAFYPSILGAIFIGITIALLLEAIPHKTGRSSGLGLGGVTLALWLTVGGLSNATRGLVVMWSLVAVLIGLSLLEGMLSRRGKR